MEDVVIKVLKPGIEDILVADMNFVYIVARILEFLNPELSRTSLVLLRLTFKILELRTSILSMIYTGYTLTDFCSQIFCCILA